MKPAPTAVVKHLVAPFRIVAGPADFHLFNFAPSGRIQVPKALVNRIGPWRSIEARTA